MAGLVVTPPTVNGVPVCGGHDRFPVCHVYCVGRNYAVHTRKMGSDLDREPPFFFYKPADAAHYAADGEVGQFVYLTETEDCHYEVELVVVIGTGGRDIAIETAAHHVYGYAIGLDIIRRSLQNTAKKGGRPWETGKAFGGSIPIDPIVPAKNVTHPDKGAVTLSVNGRKHQRDDPLDLIWSVLGTTAYLPRLFELRPGGLIYTGTSEGVGPVAIGDLVVGKIDGTGGLHIKVVWQTH